MSLDLTGEGRRVEAAQADRAFDRLIRLAGLSARPEGRSTMAETTIDRRPDAASSRSATGSAERQVRNGLDTRPLLATSSTSDGQ
jgi:hypothetical protein